MGEKMISSMVVAKAKNLSGSPDEGFQKQGGACRTWSGKDIALINDKSGPSEKADEIIPASEEFLAIKRIPSSSQNALPDYSKLLKIQKAPVKSFSVKSFRHNAIKKSIIEEGRKACDSLRKCPIR